VKESYHGPLSKKVGVGPRFTKSRSDGPRHFLDVPICNIFLSCQQIGMTRVALFTSLLPRRHIPARIPLIAITSPQQQCLPINQRSFTSTAMADHPTLVKPPPIDPTKSSIENVLELTELSAIAPVRCYTSIPLLIPVCQYQSANLLPLGSLHQHQTSLAPSRSTRYLRRRSDRTMPRRRPANRPIEFHSAQHALLFRASWRL
jgi:hypothetical protein